jgi:acetylornithine deacetylase
VKTFLEQNHDYTEVIVAEPTLAKATLAHRGIQSGKLEFHGVSGHSSAARSLKDNAIHKSARWLNMALNWIEERQHTFMNLKGVPFNVGRVEGGIKNNMIAANCDVTFSFRPLPGMNSNDMLKSMRAEARKIGITRVDYEMTPTFFGPTLPAANQGFREAYDEAEELAIDCGLVVGPAVDFWTEASLFSEASITALVYGPGDIAQAHTPDEWVALEQLNEVVNQYIYMIN